MQFSVDPDDVSVLAPPWATAAEAVAALDLGAVLAPIVVALPASATAAAVPMLGSSWSVRFRALGEAVSGQSMRLGAAAYGYAGDEAGVRSLFSGAVTPAGSQGHESPGGASPGGASLGGASPGGASPGGASPGGGS